MTTEPWPELPWTEWQPTIDTLHMWLQIVGKVRMATAAPQNHFWHSTLYVTARGLTTSPIPTATGHFQIDLDFIDHRLDVRDTQDHAYEMDLAPMSVATFYRELMAGLGRLGIDVHIRTKPMEVDPAIPFDVDEQHASYEPMHAHLLWRAMVDADRVLKAWQTGFVGKVSPVHLFWGGFDLATSRYSGRPAPKHPGGVPNMPDWVNVEAFSQEEFASGWWPRADPPGPSFYSYTYPAPPGIESAVLPGDGSWDEKFSEFILSYDAVRTAADPDAAVLDFFKSTYEAGADLGGWDRASLEAAEIPDTPPKRPWSTRRPEPKGSR